MFKLNKSFCLFIMFIWMQWLFKLLFLLFIFFIEWIFYLETVSAKVISVISHSEQQKKTDVCCYYMSHINKQSSCKLLTNSSPIYFADTWWLQSKYITLHTERYDRHAGESNAVNVAISGVKRVLLNPL